MPKDILTQLRVCLYVKVSNDKSKLLSAIDMNKINIRCNLDVHVYLANHRISYRIGYTFHISQMYF